MKTDDSAQNEENNFSDLKQEISRLDQQIQQMLSVILNRPNIPESIKAKLAKFTVIVD